MNDLRKLYNEIFTEGLLIHNLDFEITPSSGFLVELPSEGEAFEKTSLADFINFIKKKAHLLMYSENFLYVYKKGDRFVFTIGVHTSSHEEAVDLAFDYNQDFIRNIDTKKFITLIK